MGWRGVVAPCGGAVGDIAALIILAGFICSGSVIDEILRDLLPQFAA